MVYTSGHMDSQGFTLVEVLVALAIFSGLMLTLFSAFNAFTTSSRMIRDRQDHGQIPGLDVMVSDLSQLFVLQPPRFQPGETEEDVVNIQERFRFLAEQDSIKGKTVSTLRFASLSPVRFSRLGEEEPPAGIIRIVYYVYAHEDRLDLHRSDRPAVLTDEEWEAAPCKDPVLARDIRGFDLVFFDTEGEELETWDSFDKEKAYALPSRVDIRITMGTEEAEKEMGASVALMVTRPGEK